MKFKILVGILAVSLTACKSTQWINGSWEGTGQQVDGLSWKVLLFVDTKVGTEIDYPDLNCGGIWSLEAIKHHQVAFIESIEYGQEQCNQGVEVIAKRISPTQILLEYWMRNVYPDKPIATATLEKVNP